MTDEFEAEATEDEAQNVTEDGADEELAEAEGTDGE